MRFTNTIIIDRQPAVVFAYLADFENLPRWNHAIHETRKISGGPVDIGSRYRQTRTLPTPSSETFEVTDFEPDRRVSIDGALGPFRGEVTYLVTAAVDGTALTNTMNLHLSGPLRFAAPLASSRVQSAVAANLATLKQILEASSRPDDD
jgi:uncharacterized protein YndB with AHSA1/START domain